MGMKSRSEETATVLEWLTSNYPDSSKRTLRQWIDHGRVAINGREASIPHFPIQKGDLVEVRDKAEKGEKGIKILYEDSFLVVIDKPSGLLTVTAPKEVRRTAHSALKRRHPGRKITPVHRLDKDTSGILVFAYTDKSRDDLKAQFFHHTVKRDYLAIVQGEISDKGKWVCDLAEDRSLYVHPVPDGEGKQAITHFLRLKEKNGRSYVRFRLETGRKNQIRAQALHFGFPLLGDEKYGGPPSKRLALHAATLTFVHPMSGKEMSFTSPLPSDFPLL